MHRSTFGRAAWLMAIIAFTQGMRPCFAPGADHRGSVQSLPAVARIYRGFGFDNGLMKCATAPERVGADGSGPRGAALRTSRTVGHAVTLNKAKVRLRTENRFILRDALGRDSCGT